MIKIWLLYIKQPPNYNSRFYVFQSRKCVILRLDIKNCLKEFFPYCFGNCTAAGVDFKFCVNVADVRVNGVVA